MCVGAVCVTGLAAQENTPSLEDTSEELRDVLSDLEEARLLVKKSKKALEDSQRSLKVDETNFVALAGLVQAQDNEIDILQRSIRQLVSKQLSYEAQLAEHQRTGSAALSALSLLARTPPSAYFLDSSAPHTHARMGALLRSMGPSIADEASKLLVILEGLAYTQTETLKQRKAAEILREEQSLRMASLQRGIRLKKSKIVTVEKNLSHSQRRQRDLFQQSKDLKDLLAAIDRENRAEETRRKVAARIKRSKEIQKTSPTATQDIAKPAPSETLVALAPKAPLVPLRRFKGGLVIPTAGEIFRNFGEKTVEGRQSPGLAIRTEGGRTVTAPARGDVEYAGNFRSYGGTVIIRTSKNLRLVVFGLGELSVSKGEVVNEGQQIGLSSQVLEPVIYLEAWRNNSPVNPVTAKVQG